MGANGTGGGCPGMGAIETAKCNEFLFPVDMDSYKVCQYFFTPCNIPASIEHYKDITMTLHDLTNAM